MKKKVLLIENFSLCFKKEKPVLKNINIVINKGESIGIVGPSGCGKSILSLACLNLLPKSASFSGNIYFFNDKKNSVFDLNSKDIYNYRGVFSSIIFQNPFSSLNPVYTCGYTLRESLIRTGKFSKKELKKICFDLLKEVGIKNIDRVYNSYPHQLSGGQLQRVLIASCLALSPKLIIADEPTTALDASIKKNILNLLFDIIKKRNISLLIISHDINAIKNYTDYVYIFEKGNIIEKGETKNILKKPKKEFTKNLILCKPVIGEKRFFLPSQKNYDIKESIHKKSKEILFIKNISYNIKNKNILNNINFKLFYGDCLGIVGESGSGKSTIAKIICGLINNYNGSVFFNKKIINKNEKKIQIVFQESISSLTPNYKVGELLYEVCVFFKYEKSKIKNTILNFFKITNLDKNVYNKYPHQLSGGQKQRISIIRILLSKPEIIVFDESLSALDIITQANILNLIKYLKFKYNLSIIFISHDLGSVSFLCNKIIVLKDGTIVDNINAKNILDNSNNKYTKKLINDTI